MYFPRSFTGPAGDRKGSVSDEWCAIMHAGRSVKGHFNSFI